MGDVNASAVMRADQQAEIKTPTQKQGALKSEGKEHTIYPFADTESVSEGVSKFLGEANEQPQPETTLADHTFTPITQETVDVETEIAQLCEEIEQAEPTEKGGEAPKTKTPQGLQQKTNSPQPLPLNLNQKANQPEPVYSSLFSLAQSFNKGLTETRQQKQFEKQARTEIKEETRPSQKAAFSTPEAANRETPVSKGRYDQQQKEGSGGGQQHQQQKDQKKKKQYGVQASHSVNSSPKMQQSLGSMESIYIRFMALMARILGQAEAEAHSLYQRIKQRTDSIDHLTLLISKINSEKGEIDWANNEEMKQLVEKARALGVDIPEGKYAWSEEEKKLLKENIQMRKDSMEKMTQLERTDMQRYLQESSQCHQARSNVLKLLKEVMDTIIHNMRP